MSNSNSPGLTALTAVLSSSNAAAHVIRRDTYASPGALGFIFPAPRSYNATSSGTRPCGVAEVSATRDYIPLNGGNLYLLSQTKVENIQVNFANSKDPKDQSDFENLGMAMTGLTAGDTCFPLPDFTDHGLTLGDKITLQIAYATEDNSGSKLYQCADIELISAHDYEAPAYTCTNTSTIWSDSDASPTSSVVTTVTVAASSGKVGPLAAGWIGAVVALAVAALALGLAYYWGLLMFKSRRSGKLRYSGGPDPLQLHSQPNLSADDISLHRRTTVDHKGPL
ncbi:hypothetical protein I302_105560 [Kwoniella bestiolae CBS 10118]|uniref:Copper acquisition factor BIM1-like domain-containing protein n=1 Tax=Kwoniella bestiolae CBS 10118 TaxID=1296100 RepID=A0A1B9FTH2_9TREE|nr:hypothetical protein I302_08843 [Kwoniella bestiolae CBS 10118]OCF22062.1 hypothetical protein I302_08843 [Kwoniella bestiolae CBS 10118]